MEKIQGLLAAVFTPFHTDGSVNADMIPVLADKMVHDGLTGIFICGSNGEGPNMTIEERMQVAEAFIKAVDKRIKVIVHVGHSCLEDCKRLAAHASAIGADAFSSVSAFYFKPSSELNLARCMAEIASAAPALPFYYYHIPVLTGMHTNMIKFLQYAEELIPNLAGIKYTASLINEYQTCLTYKNGKFDILYGYDELLLPALAVGAKAAIGSTYNFAAPLYLKTMELFNSGQIEKARDNHKIAVDMIDEFVKYPSIPAQKAILKMLGFDLGPSRLPLETLGEKDYQALQQALERSGFFKALAQLKQTNHKTSVVQG